MLSYMPTLLLPPLVPPPSISSRINEFLDNVQTLFQQGHFEKARDSLFTAYALFQTEDALMDYYKSYFHTMNGLLLLKMIEFDDYDAESVSTSHLSKLAITAFTDAIDVSQKLVTCDRAFPRYFLGFFFYRIRRYDLALKFFRQAETLALAAEGKTSVFAVMARFDIAVLGLKMLIQKINAKSGIDRFQVEKQCGLLVQTLEKKQNYDMVVVDSLSIQMAEKTGFDGLQRPEDLVSDNDVSRLLAQCYDTQDFDTTERTQQSFSVLYSEFYQIAALFEQTVGPAHCYTGEAHVACSACEMYAQALGTELNPEVASSDGILEYVHRQKDCVEEALYGFSAKFKKIPARPLYVPIKKAKAGKKK